MRRGDDHTRLEPGIPPAWASTWGRDECGTFASFALGEVEQRMRWIAPGTFMMGSPEHEAGRFADEGPQHGVSFTKGFWMADTPCTQALWQAVMGGNPSRFTCPRRPVERVSWDDAQQFVTRLRTLVPGLDADLPSEARWEYACRAGTTTATPAGELDIRGANDAPILDAIAWYGGNSGHHGFDLREGAEFSLIWSDKQYPHQRAATREVATRRANAWGLYDMLGNVWEWCADRFGEYDGEASIDPPPRDVGEQRVCRGGSWGFQARYVRSASRDWWSPEARLVNLGFRLAAGQGLRGAADQPSSVYERG